MATNEQVAAWLTANPTATDAEITAAAAAAGVTAAQLAAVTGLNESAVIARMSAAAPASQPSVPAASTPTASAPTSYLEQVKAKLTPEQYQQLIAPLMFTANENFGGNIQDYQAQLVTPLDTSKLNFPKKVDESTAGVRQISDGFISTQPTVVNGVPVYAKYDTSGNLSAYQGDNLGATTWTNGENRLVGNWEPSGKAAPISIGSQTGLFNTGYHWNDIRDNLEAAAVVAGNYFLPGSSMLTSQLVTEGAQENLNTDAGRLINAAAGAAGGFQGNAANYGKIGDALGITGSPTDALAADNIDVGGGWNPTTGTGDAATAAAAAATGVTSSASIPHLFTPSGLDVNAGVPTTPVTTVPTTGPTSITDTIKNLTPSQIATLTKAGINIASLIGAGAAVQGITGSLNNTGGGGMLTQQDRSGISSGTANYSPEYYQAIQAKYNQMMPQQPRDVTTDLKSWYETKYAPKVA